MNTLPASTRTRHSLAAVVLALAAITAASCSTGQATPAKIKTEYVERDESGDTFYLEPVPTESRKVDWKNYQVGVRETAKVGEPIIVVKDYTVSDRVMRSVARHSFAQLGTTPKSETLTADEIESLSCTSKPFVYMRGHEDQSFRLSGAVVEDGEVYFLNEVDAPEGTLFFATDGQGRLKPGTYLAWRDADAKSIVTHPTTTTHQRLSDEQRAALGITPGLVRLSVGIEDPVDLNTDLKGALEAV